MEFNIPEGDGMLRYTVEWFSSDGERFHESYDYWHDAVGHYFHLKDLGRETNVMIMALPLPNKKKEEL